MQDNELDKLINDAANQHHPPYDDEAWGKMLVLLDKHLPQKKDRRRPFIFLLLFLLLGTAIALGVLQPWNKSKTDVAAANTTADKTGSAAESSLPPGDNATAAAPAATANTATQVTPATIPGNAVVPEKTNNPPAATTTAGSVSKPKAAQAQSSNEDVERRTANNFTSKGKSVIKIKKPGAVAEEDAPTASSIAEKKPTGKTTTDPAAQEEAPVVAEKTVSEPTQPADAAVTENKKDEKIIQPEKKDSSAATIQTTVTATENKKTKKDKSFVNNFALTFSTGADMSFVELNNPGKIKLFYGVGAAYSIGKRLRVGAGFYVSKKIYNASPYQYKFPNGAVYPNLKEINADCNVYEIPLSVYYNFKQHKKHNWFAGAGISSLLMKKEHYDYLYKTPTGQSYSYARTVVDENKHYFSVVTLSAGYQYNLNNRISLIAEPYFKLPLGGVGAGQIKLNSTGLLFTAAVKPFARSKK